MPSALENAANRFRRELLNQEREAASAMVQAYGEAWQRVSQRTRELQGQIELAGPMVSPSWLFERDRLSSLQAQIEAELRRFAMFATDATAANQMRAIEAAGRHTAGLVDLAAGVRPVGIEVPFDVLPTAALQDLVGFASDGSPLRDLFGEISGGVADRVTEQFVSSVAAGFNPRVTARLIRQAFAIGLSRALTIARTETMRAYTEAAHRNYEANSNVLDGWIWCASLSTRTCAACWAMHGTFHKLDERLHDHINGRCSPIPRVKSWKALGYDVPDRRPEVEKGVDIFRRLPPEQQREILGAGAFEAYRAGTVSLSQFAGHHHSDDWGTSLQRRGLREIIGAEAANQFIRTAYQAGVQERRITRVLSRAEIMTGRLVDAWTSGTTRRTSVLLREAAKAEFDLPGLVYNPRNYALGADEIAETRILLRRMYEQTQAALQAQGIETVRLYRGIKGNYAVSPIESWTLDLNIAQEFGSFGILEEELSSERVLIYSGGPNWRNGKFGEQHEYIVLLEEPR